MHLSHVCNAFKDARSKRPGSPAPVWPRKCWILAPLLHSQHATVLSKEPVTSFCSSNLTVAHVCVWIP